MEKKLKQIQQTTNNLMEELKIIKKEIDFKSLLIEYKKNKKEITSRILSMNIFEASKLGSERLQEV
ncbi:MAG: hypothetical protein HRS50_01495, partial [Mycoplasmataceae bacterium]|nr:hypothetical protein [Mycoplasmataceae bacterium]